jgi:hypothetical protein
MKQILPPLKEIETKTKEMVVYLYFYAILDCHKILKRNIFWRKKRDESRVKYSAVSFALGVYGYSYWNYS